ncbi:putative auxin efflux carrier family protein [Klebsormidium nitens]|uniref:Putative auxin efflux carrier family protein n=1 Tax=Klebsormidium nitens TaxID=105231 RepID=A0A1Y1ITM2_KLENI|nr:putative auxin efflux carrier family protein [Klebsormidium nitens]|eukprot:GAQ92166.1 putative auxin efflux carrier family protein [Klebsormidium nitens]
MADAGFLPPWLSGALEGAAGALTGAPQPAHQMDLRKLILSACLPVLKVLIIAGTGLVLATPYMGVLNVEARKHISKLVFVLLLPALVFVKLGQGVDITNMIKWYFIPINILAGCTIGCFLGYIVVLICKPPLEYTRLVIFTVGIGNMGNLPLVLVTAVCQDPSNPFGDTASCLARGVSYVAFGMWPLAIILWTLVYDSLQLPAEHSLRMGTTPRRRLSVATGLRAPLLDDSERKLTRSLYKKVKSFAKLLRLHQIMRPPIAGALAALFVGAIPPLKWALFDTYGPFRVVTDSVSIIGQAMIPCLILVLGGNLGGGPGASDLNSATMVGICIMRLVVLPALGMCFVLTAKHLGLLLVEDKMYIFVLLLQHTMPTSIQVGTAATLRGYGEKEISAALFWEHICALFSVTLWLLVYIYYLFPI